MENFGICKIMQDVWQLILLAEEGKIKRCQIIERKKDFWGKISLRDMIIMSKSISFIFSHKIDLNTEAVEFSFDLPKKNEC